MDKVELDPGPVGIDESNFAFLAQDEPLFFQLASAAERLFAFDPNASLLKLRQLGEAMARAIAVRVGIEFDERAAQSDLLASISRRLGLDPTVRQLFHTLRIEGNRAAHTFETSHKEAMDGLKVARQLAIWYHRAFGRAGRDFKPGRFQPPLDPTARLRELQAEIGRLQSQLSEAQRLHESDRELLELKTREAEEQAALAQQLDEERRLYEQLALEAEANLAQALQAFEQQLVEARPPVSTVQETVAQVRRDTRGASRSLRLSEDETRILIDAQLRERGWQADSQLLDYRRGARPEPGKNMAIAEWPCRNPETGNETRADYVLFVGLRPVATVEAKRFGNDVQDDLRQAEEYSRDLQLDAVQARAINDGRPLYLPTWPADETGAHSFKVPFAFSTNGREFQHQIKSKSGIWFRDLRDPYNNALPL